MKVLVADDDKIFATGIATVFRKRGWQVVVAADTMQTLMLAKQQPFPDIILLDLKMPGGSGDLALERLKASTLTMGIPVLVVSASEDPDVANRVRGEGAVGFVKKPVDADVLAVNVERFLEMQRKG